MGLNKTADGRYIVGQGVENGNNYHGFNGKRDIVIQLTADGATADGLNALEYLKAYALNAKTENKPIFPDGARVWISTNGYSKAVEADDVVIDGSNITIGGIAWNGSAWDFSNAGQSGGGGTGGGGYATTTLNGGVVVLDKTWKEIKDGKIAVIVSQYEENHVGFMFTNEIYANGGKYYISAMVPNSLTGNILSDFLIYLFETNSENGYPSYTVGGE